MSNINTNLEGTQTECPWCGEQVWQRFDGAHYIDTEQDGTDHNCPVNQGINPEFTRRQPQVLAEKS